VVKAHFEVVEHTKLSGNVWCAHIRWFQHEEGSVLAVNWHS